MMTRVLDISDADDPALRGILALHQGLILELMARPGAWVPGCWQISRHGPLARQWRAGVFDLKN